MAGSNLADLAHKSMVLFLAGTTIYYVTNITMHVRHRIELKKEGSHECNCIWENLRKGTCYPKREQLGIRLTLRRCCCVYTALVYLFYIW
ncbi:hypothetical protein DM01DRAFT_195275 [Hesseltinella vesiculosa]|uniref:Uncharacterized protein n=1 Tax=Hesseltinella vesiculosa TaxID=101127 RepID=A0A1X2G394_9FUNG|nr:hypothetical protein DM01DRAFT_195275 [Hesseltinella vesiculosa]